MLRNDCLINGEKNMDRSKRQLKTDHKFLDYLYWNLVAAVPFVTAGIAILKNSVAWLFCYIIVCIFLIVVIYRFYCTHCPYYIQSINTTKCMFFWGIPKYFKSQPGPLGLFERDVKRQICY